MLRLGVVGGTFDPVHYGHLILAEQAAECLNLSKVLFMPSGTPPHKDIDKVAPTNHRLEMLKLAIGDNSRFELSTIEHERAGKNYSYETFEILSDIYAKDTEFFFIIGSDVLFDLLTFKNFEILSKKCSFAVALRAGADMSAISATTERLCAEYGARVVPVPLKEIDISSTMIKERLGSGKSIRYLTPESVRLYIETNGLYHW